MRTNTTTAIRYLGTCPTCHNALAITTEEADAHGAGATVKATCPTCGATATVKALHGTYRGDSPCDDRCMYAVGPKCECACAGVNHGGGYIPATGYDIELVTKANAKRKATNAKRAATTAAKRAEKAAAKAQAKADALADAKADTLKAYPNLARLTDVANAVDNEFMDSMVKAFDAGRMTDRQAAAASAVVARTEARNAARAAQDAARDAAAARGVKAPCDGKRATHTVTVDAVWCKETMYGVTMMMRVTHQDGWSARVSVPSKLAYAVNLRQSSGGELAQLRSALVGTQVTVTASWGPSWDNDAMVSDGKRPAADRATIDRQVAASHAWMVAEEVARDARREAAGLPRL